MLVKMFVVKFGKQNRKALNNNRIKIKPYLTRMRRDILEACQNLLQDRQYDKGWDIGKCFVC